MVDGRCESVGDTRYWLWGSGLGLMSRSNGKGGVVWELMPRRRGPRSTVGWIGGRNRQVRGGIEKGLSESMVRRCRGGQRQTRAQGP